MKETADPPGRISIDGAIYGYACGLRDDSFNNFQTGTNYWAAIANSATILRPAELEIL